GLTVSGATGVLRTNASTVSVAGTVNINNPAGYITTTGAGLWTVSGAWTNVSTSASWSFAASITFNASSSQTMAFANLAPEFGGNVTFNSGASTTTLTMATGQRFYSVVIGGTISITSPVTAAGILTVNNGAVLTKTGQSITFNGLTEIGSGSIADGAISVGNFSVTNSDPTNLTTITVFTTWTVDSQYTWTDSSTVGTSTITFAIGGNTVGYRFNVMKD